MNATRKWILVVPVLFVVLYLLGPVVASVFEIGDRRGPRIYPAAFHTRVYMLVWEFTPHQAKKPRLSFLPVSRPWFYGLPQHRLDSPLRTPLPAASVESGANP